MADGRWRGAISLGNGPDGKRLRQTFYGKSQEEVDKLVTAALSERDKGLATDPTKETVQQFLERWLNDVMKHRVRPVTLVSYRYTLRHAYAALGSLPLTKLTPPLIQRLYTQRLDAGASRRTVQYIHSILHKALNQAVRWNLLARNPCDAVDAPRPVKRDMVTLTEEELRQLVDVMVADELRPLYVLAILTGARRGELVALRWQDVDLVKGAIRITRTAEQVGNTVVWSEPKTAKSRRLIPLPAEAIPVLKAHKAAQAELKMRQRLVWREQGLVFTRWDGSPYIPEFITRHFGLLVQKAGVPRVRLHDLRHTHATLLLQAGIHPKVVSERLGHSTTTLTMDTYSHVLPTMQEEAARTLDNLLGEGKKR
jgi:integrase